MLELPLRSFTDAKIAQNGLNFSGFVAWVGTHEPEIVPDFPSNLRRRYNNHVPNFNLLRKRFNDIDEESGFLTIEKTQLLFRYFDLDTQSIAQSRSLLEQASEGVPEEERCPREFQDAMEAFEYIRPPPIEDDEGVSHIVEELTFQDFCHMTMHATDAYFEVILLRVFPSDNCPD